MFSFFFNDKPVTDYTSALASDSTQYKKFFHACLDHGVYLAPSAYEAGFLSTAHEGSAIDKACEVISSAIAKL